jgi:GNAT superfamily N-acetyltransferase
LAGIGNCDSGEPHTYLDEVPGMNVDRVPLFCDTALAQRIERVEAQLIANDSKVAHRRNPEASGFLIPVAGGVASFAERDSPFNKVVGLGFSGVPSADALEEIENGFASCGAPVQIELSHLGDPALGTLLTERGYRLVSFENVLGFDLRNKPERVTPPGIEIRPSGDDEFDAWIDVVMEGAIHPDTQGVATHEDFPRDVLETAERDSAAGLIRYVALREGVFAGGASFTMVDRIAALTGAATAPPHRRKGIQTALLSARLADAAAAGCDVAVITTQPGSKSQQNAQRRGFDLLYTRAVLLKPI